MFLLENNTIDVGEVDVGRRAIQDVPPGQLPTYTHTHTLKCQVIRYAITKMNIGVLFKLL